MAMVCIHEWLDADSLLRILAALTDDSSINSIVRPLLDASLVCRLWRDLARHNDVWLPLLERLLVGKVFLPAWFLSGPRSPKSGLRAGGALELFRDLVIDAKRTEMTHEEFSAAGTRWYQRMKLSAGDGWRETDPWWLGKGSGRVTQYCSDGQMRSDPRKWAPNATEHEDFPFTDEERWEAVGRWRFFPRFSGQVEGETAAAAGWASPRRSGVEGGDAAVLRASRFVRIRPDLLDREVPTSVFFRHPGNWGWVADSAWSIMANFPLPPLGTDPCMEDESLPVRPEHQWVELGLYNHQLPLPWEDWDGWPLLEDERRELLMLSQRVIEAHAHLGGGHHSSRTLFERKVLRAIVEHDSSDECL